MSKSLIIKPHKTRRRLYKAERPPARKEGVLKMAPPIALPDANAAEIASAIHTYCDEMGFEVGRTDGYDANADTYYLIGKSKRTGKAQDLQVVGEHISTLIRFCRLANGGPLNTQEFV